MTSRDNKYFLLLVDDLSRYMWIVMIPFKDRAVAAIIKEIAPTTEASSPQGSSQSIVRLRACITDTHHPIAHSRTANIIEHQMARWWQPLGACSRPRAFPDGSGAKQ
jgi:hypothetical protein